MKNFISALLAALLVVCLVVSGYYPAQAAEVAADELLANTVDYYIDGRKISVTGLETFDKLFLEQAAEDGYATENFVFYDSGFLFGTDEGWGLLENRVGTGKIIVERSVGVCYENGDGLILDLADVENNYISYRGVAGAECGGIIATYYIYNPETNYTDDALERYDYIISVPA